MSTFHRTTETYQQGAHTMPARYYVAPEVLAEEHERILGTGWLCIGRADQVRAPGEYVVHDVFGESIIIVRDRGGQVRAHYNVCRHRGTRICEERQGAFSETIQCPYHAWTYTLEGRLIGAPHMHEVAGFDKARYPLHSAALHEWEGFLFVSLAADPEPFDEVFAPLLGRFARFNLGMLQRVQRIDYTVQANWKLIFQNYSECLHCPVIHPELSSLMPYQSGENDLVEGPSLGGFMVISEPNESMTITGRACGVPLGDLSAEERRRAYYYTIMPNLMLSIHPDYVVYYTLWPETASRTRVTCEWMVHPDSLARGDDPSGAVEFWDITNKQDWHICERSQAGISSRAYTPGPYSPRESIPAAWDRAYLEMMRG
jgi:phenylpropionate dioxygenase-like ring-hydroxylating dioxygenase large terminal subunit